MNLQPNPEIQEYLHSEIMMDLTWNIHPGEIMQEFFRRLKQERTLYGVRCPQCQRVYLPPRLVCGNCWRETREWIMLGTQGTVEAKTVCYYSILNSETGKPRPTPFVLGLIRLDGADTTLNHFVEAVSPAHIRIGSRAQIVFRDVLQGNIGDILHFKLISQEPENTREP